MESSPLHLIQPSSSAYCIGSERVSLDRLCILNNSEVVVLSLTLCTDLPVEEGNSSYVHYFGNSYLEFEGIDLSALNNITVRFQTQVSQGTILYVDQGPAYVRLLL
ncbi:hypothetical protein NQZ68_002758 [Dissostichus eleginoides]|nr:hypothetical protein NQZ68_002758 [Dissostichus eleginoides]